MTTTTKAKANGTGAVEPYRRIRLVAVTVQLNVVSDDGDILTPLGVEPIQLTAAQWSEWQLDAVIAEIDRQYREKATDP